MVQLTQGGAVVAASAEELTRLRGQFDRLHCILLPSLLEPGLLHLLQRQVAAATFNQKAHEGLSVELCMADNAASHLLHFLTHDPRLFEIIRQLTGCGRIGCFTGRIYRMVPGARHYDSWHNDMGEHRMVGMSVNLSEQVYSGGIFQIRDRESLQTVHEAANTGFGDGIIFRLSPHLQHRMTEVDGAVPKTAFAGWFQSQPDFYAGLKVLGQETAGQAAGPDNNERR